MLSKEELLKEGYKVIASYPNSIHKVGDIYRYVREVAQYYDEWKNQEGQSLYNPPFSKYPHLFRKVEWWEGRKIEDFPKYVFLNKERTINSNKVFKVDSVKHFRSEEDFEIYIEGASVSGARSYYFLPADETDYNNYINSLNGDENAK